MKLTPIHTIQTQPLQASSECRAGILPASHEFSKSPNEAGWKPALPWRDRLFSPPLNWMPIALAFGLFTLATSHAGQILFIYRTVSPSPGVPSTITATDDELVKRLNDQGHKVILAHSATVAESDTVGRDLILISSSTGDISPTVNALCRDVLRKGRIPVVNCEPLMSSDLLLQTGTWRGGLRETALEISDTFQNHPLAAGKSGVIEIANAGELTYVSPSSSPPSMGADAIIIASTISARPVLWAYEAGSRLADNFTIVPSRRVALFWNASTTAGAYNSNATDLLDAVVEWALEGTPKGEPPTVNFTSPAEGSRFPTGATVAFVAMATAAAGQSITKVEFFDTGTKIGEATSSPFAVSLSSLPEGRYTVVAKATDTQGLFKFSAQVRFVVGSPTETMVLFAIDDNQVWRYNDSGEDLSTSWREKDFDDRQWPNGKALIAAESGRTAEPIRTRLPFPLGSSKYVVTYYFRTHFNFPGSDRAGVELSLRHVIDDGAVFYLNGKEVSRFLMPSEGDVYANTYAAGLTENNYRGPFPISAASLVPGDNVFAVEVHQCCPDSSDIVFGAELKATVPFAPNVAPPALVGQPSDQLIDIGAAATNQVTATGTSVAYQWLFNGTALTDATNSVFVIPDFQPRHAGDYSVVVTNPAGAVTSRAAKLELNIPKPHSFGGVRVALPCG